MKEKKEKDKKEEKKVVAGSSKKNTVPVDHYSGTTDEETARHKYYCPACDRTYLRYRMAGSRCCGVSLEEM